jgi:predicted ATPase/DNA-binding XRE family transcriptional regulator
MDLETDRGVFGQVLRRLRLAAGLSQEALAERARLSVESISALERGRRKAPYRETIRMLSDALHLTEGQRQELVLAAKRSRSPALHGVRFDSYESTRSATPEKRDVDEPKQNLARSLSTFYGRKREIADLTRLIEDHRLVTLTGAGGIGKTRIAVELGWTLLERFPDGVWFVDLAPLSDHSVIARSFFDALRIPLNPAQDDIATLTHHLRRRDALLIIDNCEHVVEQVAVLLESLLPSCDSLRIIATSREPLRVIGERVYRIPTLEAPSDKESVRAADSLAFSSVALFVDRARAANATFVYDDTAAPTVAAICRRLDGIALAIELAASRTAALSPKQILAQLERHLRILGRGARTAALRQQTMHETIRWSYDRLDDAEQKLFRRVAVFPSGFTLTGVSSVMGGDSDSGAATLDLLMQLIDKSVVVSETCGTIARYRLLEPMRAFGLEMLDQAKETQTTRLLFADWCIEFAHTAHTAWATSPTPAWFAAVEPEMENLRACLVWTLQDRNDIEHGQRLISTGRRIWARLSPYEGANWIDSAKRLVGPQTPADLQAGLALAEAHLHVALQQYGVVVSAAETFERLTDGKDPLLLAEARCFAGHSLTRLGQSAEGERLMTASIAVYRAHDADQLAATGITDLACAHLARDDASQARHLFREALAIFRKLGNKRGIASVAANLAEAEYAADNVDCAIQLCREALATSSSGREARIFLSNLAAYLVRAGAYDEARARARESLLLPGLARADVDVALAIQHLSAVAALRTTPPNPGDEHVGRAARLLGFVDYQLAKFGVTRLPTESYEYVILIDTLKAVLGEQRFAGLREEGLAWTADDAVDEALRI